MIVVITVAAALIVLLLLTLVLLLASAVDRIQNIADNAHIIRAGTQSIRSRLHELNQTIDRMETHVRGPSANYRPPKAAPSANPPNVIHENP